MMDKRPFIMQTSILALAIFFSCLYAFPESNVDAEREDWDVISSRLRCFLNDPFTNISDIEKIDDLFYWTMIYTKVYEGGYVNELFSRHFMVNDIDCKALDIIYFLLVEYSCPTNRWEDAGIEPILSRIIEVIKAKPVWFFNDLVKRASWKNFLRLIALDRTVDLNHYCAAVPDPDIRAEILGFLNELEIEKRSEVQRLEEFLKDPVNNFDKIKDIYFLCSVMTVRDRGYVDQNRNLPAEYFSPGFIADYIKEDPDEKKIEILLHIISHCTTPGLETEVIMELGAEVFYEHPGLFARCLSKHRVWRSIVYLISYFLSYRDPGFRKVINGLGNTDFENELKAQLNFLSNLGN
jgi:hypothetical protein